MFWDAFLANFWRHSINIYQLSDNVHSPLAPDQHTVCHGHRSGSSGISILILLANLSICQVPSRTLCACVRTLVCACADICFRFHSLQPRCRVPQTFWERGLQESRFHSHRYSLQQHISPENIFPKPFFFLVFFFFLFLYLVLCVVLEVFDNRSAKCAALQKISRDGCVR